MPAEDRHRATRRKMRRSSSRLAITESHGGMPAEKIFGQRLHSFRIDVVWSLTVSIFCSRATEIVGASWALVAMMKTWFLETAVLRSSLEGSCLKSGVSFLYDERFDTSQKFTHSSSIHP